MKTKGRSGAKHCLFRQLQTVKTVGDSQDSCWLSKHQQTLADCQDICRQLKTVKATANCCRPLQTCLFLSFQWDAAGITFLMGGTKDQALPSHSLTNWDVLLWSYCITLTFRVLKMYKIMYCVLCVMWYMCDLWCVICNVWFVKFNMWCVTNIVTAVYCVMINVMAVMAGSECKWVSWELSSDEFQSLGWSEGGSEEGGEGVREGRMSLINELDLLSSFPSFTLATRTRWEPSFLEL